MDLPASSTRHRSTGNATGRSHQLRLGRTPRSGSADGPSLVIGDGRLDLPEDPLDAEPDPDDLAAKPYRPPAHP
jgi:hypothetical protein